MSSGYLWAVDAAGTPNKLTASPCPAKDDFLEWIPAHLEGNLSVRQLAAAPNFVWAIGANGRAYVYLTYSHIAVRVVEETFENERWYMVVGWSSRTLPTDRPNFSDRNGDFCLPKDSFHLPSDGWVWEDSWMVDLNETEYDKTGWQYAFNFSSKEFSNAHFSGAFVRRRRWVRTRKYVAIERWIMIPEDEIEKEHKHFVDITAGGFELPSQCSQGFSCSIFAVSRSGSVLYRDGIGPKCPEGTNWILVDPVKDKESDENEDLNHISCSASSGQLFALTWDGRSFVRLGITGNNRIGTGWVELARPKGLPVLSASFGERTIWLITADGKLWTTSLITPMTELVRCVTPNSWTEMSQGMCRVTVGLDDQVLAIGQMCERLHIRMDLTEKEPTGRCWKEIVARKGHCNESEREENAKDRWVQVDAGGCSINCKTIPRHWIESLLHSSSSSSSFDYLASDRKSVWRKKILDTLSMRNELIWNAFWDFSRQFGESSSWTRHAKAQVLTGTNGDWLDANLELVIEGGENGMLHVELINRDQKTELPFGDIAAAFAKCDSHSKNVMEVHSPILQQSNASSILKRPMKIALNTEDERDSWVGVVQATLCKIIPVFDKMLWAIDDQGLLFVSPISIQDQPLSQQRWLQIKGHFKYVSAGVGVVWTLSEDGRAWCMSPDYGITTDPVLGEELGLIQTDTVDEVVYEYQRSSVLSGFCTFNGTANGKYFAWSDDSGTVKKSTKEQTRLPNKHWHWANDWKMIDHELKCDADGWLYARKFGTTFDRKKGSVRRRQWTRRRVFTISAPWISIDAPKLTRLSVQNDPTNNSPFLVWAITETGDLLCRQGVTAATPAGSGWKQVMCGRQILDICAGPNYHIWAVTNAGEVRLRYCANVADILKCAWKCIPSSLKFAQIAVGASKVWALDAKGDLYQRTGVSHICPEGEDWAFAYSDVQAVTTDPYDNLFVSLKYSDPRVGTVSGVLARRASDWDYGIAGPWTCISLSSCV